MKETREKLLDAWYVSYMGLGVPRDYGRALRCLKEAAELGSAEACYHMGDMYACGMGMEADYEKAKECYLRAEALGLPRKKGDMQKEIRHMEELLNFVREKEEQERLTGEEAYLRGQKEKENPLLAFRYWLLAARKGHREAQRIVSACYMEGDLVEQNEREAKKWLQKAEAEWSGEEV